MQNSKFRWRLVIKEHFTPLKMQESFKKVSQKCFQTGKNTSQSINQSIKHSINRPTKQSINRTIGQLRCDLLPCNFLQKTFSDPLTRVWNERSRQMPCFSAANHHGTMPWMEQTDQINQLRQPEWLCTLRKKWNTPTPCSSTRIRTYHKTG